MLYHFADCTLDTALYTLHRTGQASRRLSPRVFEVLRYLLVHRDRVVSKDDLCNEVWAGVAISDATLESCIRAVRVCIGDTGKKQCIIQTQRGHGWRIIVDVREEHANSPAPRPPHLDPPPPEPVSDLVACFTCQYLNQRDVTVCASCHTRLQQTCFACGQKSPFPAALCTFCGHPFDPSPPGPLLNSGERKPITVLCCAVSLETETEQGVDLDTRYSVIQKLHDRSQDVIRRYGGRLYPTMDERLLIMFGVPVAQEDDARRAVRVALELRQHVQEHQEDYGLPERTTLALRIGLCTGPVVTGGRRDDPAAVAPVVGDVMSHARALQEHASPGSILCSDVTARLLQGAVHLQDVGPLLMPGQTRVVRTFLVIAEHFWRSPMNLSSGRRLSPFVGREREMGTLRALLAQVEEGRGQVVGVVGEAGIGKSRLVYEFRQSLKENWITYRSGRCLSYGTATPYLPVIELLRQNCNITEIDRPEDIIGKVHKSLQDVHLEPETWTPVLLHLLGVAEGTQALAALSPEVRKARTMTVLTEMCLHGSRQRPLIVEIEDLHWIDASSNEWLTALSDRISGVPLLLLGTYRPGYRPAWIDKSYATQVSVHPLAPHESLQVVQTILPTTALLTPLVPQLLAKADGNPFFLEELAQTIVEQGGEVPAMTVPDTVQAVLTARIDRLPTSTKNVLQAAAVIGRDIALPLLQAITTVSDDALQAELASLQAAEFLYETHSTSAPVYTFKHALTQEVAYQSLLRNTRRGYHARIAEVLEAQFPEVVELHPELLAQHYMEAEQAAQAIPYWQRAGQQAVERSANAEAISHFTTGLELLKTLPSTPEVIEQELTLQLAMGAPLLMCKGHTAPEVEQAYARSYELAQQLGETSQRFAVLVGLWRFYLSQARLHTAYELAEQCFALAQRLHTTESMQEAHLALGSTLFSLGDLVAARRHLEQGIAFYNPPTSAPLAFSRGTDPGVTCLARESWTLWMLGYPEQALHKCQDALRLAQLSSHAYSVAFARQFAAALYRWRRETTFVQEQAEALIVFADSHGFIQFLAGGMMRRGWALAVQGLPQEGIEQMLQGLSTWKSIGVELGLPDLLAMLSEAYGKSEQVAEGLEALRAASTIMCKTAERYYEAEIHRLRGELLLQKVPPAEGCLLPEHIEAERCFQQAINIAQNQCAKSLELRATISLSRLWQQAGKRAAAYQMLAKLYEWFTEGFDTLDLQEAKALLATLAAAR